MIYDLHNDYPTALKSDAVSKYVSDLPAGVTATAAIWTSELGSNAYKEVSRLTIALTALKVPIAIEDIGFLSELNRYETFDFSAYAYSSLTWNYNNAFAGGALDDGELTDVGKRAISIIGRSGCALDVAHLNKKSFYAAIDCADKVLCSHTGFNGHLRSLDDGQICALLDKRAIIGLSAVTAFTDAHTCDELQNVIDGFVQEYGAEHLAIGTDFLGSVDLPTDVKDYDGLAKVADGLRKRGYDEKTIYKIFYSNAYSFFNSEK